MTHVAEQLINLFVALGVITNTLNAAREERQGKVRDVLFSVTFATVGLYVLTLPWPTP